MPLTYLLLSPTFGMHQYTADLANRMAAAGHDVRLVTTTAYPAGRYAPAVTVHTPVTTHGTGFSSSAVAGLPFLLRQLKTDNWQRSTVVHLTGPHLANLPLLLRLRRAGIPTLHTLHDLDPHPGTPYGPLLHIWNALIARSATHILVHGRQYEQQLAARIGPQRVSYTPLLHGFTGAQRPIELYASQDEGPEGVGFALFFGRVEAYKGVGTLLQSALQLGGIRPVWRARGAMLGSAEMAAPWLVIAGQGDLDHVWSGPLPAGVAVRNRRIEDEEGIALFGGCAVVVLPYVQATQSALVAAAYAFGKPVIVTDTGALAEYVVPGETGWVIPPADADALARALGEALSNPAEARRRGHNGRAWFEARRREEWAALQALYQKLAASAPSY